MPKGKFLSCRKIYIRPAGPIILSGQNRIILFARLANQRLHVILAKYIFTFFSNSFPLFIASFCRLSRFLFLFTSFNLFCFLLSFASSCCKELITSRMHSGLRILLIRKELPINAMWGMCVYYKPKLNSSLWASSLGHSGSLAGKGRTACNYVSGIPEYLHWKNWCEMLIGGDDICTSVMMSLPSACAFQCLFIFVFISDSSVDGEPQGNWRWNSNSRDIVVSSPSFSCPAARVSRELPRRLVKFRLKNYFLT